MLALGVQQRGLALCLDAVQVPLQGLLQRLRLAGVALVLLLCRCDGSRLGSGGRRSGSGGCGCFCSGGIGSWRRRHGRRLLRRGGRLRARRLVAFLHGPRRCSSSRRGRRSDGVAARSVAKASFRARGRGLIVTARVRRPPLAVRTGRGVAVIAASALSPCGASTSLLCVLVVVVVIVVVAVVRVAVEARRRDVAPVRGRAIPLAAAKSRGLLQSLLLKRLPRGVEALLPEAEGGRFLVLAAGGGAQRGRRVFNERLRKDDSVEVGEEAELAPAGGS